MALEGAQQPCLSQKPETHLLKIIHTSCFERSHVGKQFYFEHLFMDVRPLHVTLPGVNMKVVLLS